MKRAQATGMSYKAEGRGLIFRLLIFLSACGLLLFPALVRADFDLQQWKFWRAILPGEKVPPGDYALVELDGPVFASARVDLGDLRVVDAQHNEVPSQLIVQRNEVTKEERAADILDRVIAPGGREMVTLDLGENRQRHNRVTLEVEARNFTRQVALEAGSDNREWATIRGDGYIFDFSRDVSSRSLTIDYPTSTRRYLRVTVLNQGEDPVDITGAEVQFVTEREAAIRPLQAELSDQGIVTRGAEARGRPSVLLLDLGWRNLPSARLQIETGERNFHRGVLIEGSNDQQVWSFVGSGDIHDVNTGGVTQRRLQIDYDEAKFRYLKVRIYNYDDRPLRIGGARVFGYPRLLVFPCEQGRELRLFYGNDDARAPRYDLERITAYLRPEQLPVLTLAGERGNLAAASAQPTSWLERQRVMLWLVMLLAAGVLGILIYRLARMNTGAKE